MMLIAVGPLVVGAFYFRPLLYAVAPTLLVLLLASWCFRSLTIEVADGVLRWRFGPGWIRKRVSLADVSGAEVVRTNVFEGWGIHYSRFGWLYNISGFDAVAVTLKSGCRFCLGTDEPDRLAAILRSNAGGVPPVLAENV